jgi:D-glycero-D-manno-heptose 1,7-bisphosphate phosphatase
VKYPSAPILDRNLAAIQNFPNGVVVFDRDGTLIEDAGQHNNPQLLTFLPGAIEAIKILFDSHFGIAIASNQSGLESEKFTLKDLLDFNSALKARIKAEVSADIHLIAVCPHVESSGCWCRKPKVGLLREIEDSGLGKLKLFVGDSETDLLAAKTFNIDFVQPGDENLLSSIKNWLDKK